MQPDNNPPDMISHPPHYTSSKARCRNCGTQIECIDVVQHLPFPIGSAVKYLWRLDLKQNSVEDMKKAVWYINREIERRSKEAV